MTLGFILRLARERKNLTLVEAAKRLGIHCASISNYENDKFYPTIRTAAAMSELYDLPWDQIRDVVLGKG